ncbi:hypothetical protein K503DRAFT_805514 [Rhizopogon vinicolor AM-OR11-026]|uniref:Uncharacterized protein n=1 Tax=Rhizopogon vinicolor AM-OR11-026 TaxID=1314800 RepID=A0A1B7MHM8_9AGAM|nr:hypothetical protein K503DRAFT_805514 [Rhizopogon vinicolor AM-OR11-026]
MVKPHFKFNRQAVSMDFQGFQVIDHMKTVLELQCPAPKSWDHQSDFDNLLYHSVLNWEGLSSKI